MPPAEIAMIAVIFDLDGTLVDSENHHFASMSAAALSMGCELSEDLASRLSGLSSEACYALLQRETQLSGSCGNFVDAKHRYYLDRSSSLAIRAGAREALTYVTRGSIPFAIASNSSRAVVDTNLAAIGMDPTKVISVSRDDVELGKPNPDPFLKAAALLGVAPRSCVAVEDSVPGAIAAHAAGMQVIGWPEPHRCQTSFPRGTRIADPKDLYPTLASYFGGER